MNDVLLPAYCTMCMMRAKTACWQSAIASIPFFLAPTKPELREILQQMHFHGMAQGAEGFDFDLADALAGQFEAGAEFFKGVAVAVLETIA